MQSQENKSATTRTQGFADFTLKDLVDFAASRAQAAPQTNRNRSSGHQAVPPQAPPQAAPPQAVPPQFVQPTFVQPQAAQPAFVQPQAAQPQVVLQPQTLLPQAPQPQMVLQPQSAQAVQPQGWLQELLGVQPQVPKAPETAQPQKTTFESILKVVFDLINSKTSLIHDKDLQACGDKVVRKVVSQLQKYLDSEDDEANLVKKRGRSRKKGSKRQKKLNYKIFKSDDEDAALYKMFKAIKNKARQESDTEAAIRKMAKVLKNKARQEPESLESSTESDH